MVVDVDQCFCLLIMQVHGRVANPAHGTWQSVLDVGVGERLRELDVEVVRALASSV